MHYYKKNKNNSYILTKIKLKFKNYSVKNKNFKNILLFTLRYKINSFILKIYLFFFN